MNYLKNSIILQAINLGFDFSDVQKEDDLDELIETFFYENRLKLQRLEDECKVNGHGHSQSVNYGDYVCTGEIVDFSDHWHEPEGTKIFHSDFILEDEGMIKYMNLYYTIGKTDYNQ